MNVGNPHCIFWVDDISAHDLSKIGPMLEHHPLFPERANISLAKVKGKTVIDLAVWERGAGLTRACGTAACAAAVAAATVHRPSVGDARSDRAGRRGRGDEHRNR